MKNAKRVGLWLRVSTEDQARGESPEHHEYRGRAYAEFKGWEIVEVYNLCGVSGKAVIEHHEAQRMINDIKKEHITGIIFSKLARLARNTKELLEFADIFKEYSADLISLQESIDTSTPAGRLFYTMIAAMAQWEREEIADRVSASIPVRAKLGKKIGGAATFGYMWEDNRLIPDPKEAPVRKQLHELYAQHRRKKVVARILNEKGYRTRKGNKFTDTTITRLLSDSTAKGVFRRNYSKKVADNKPWEYKPESEWIYIKVEPIVSEELWDKCYEIMTNCRKNHKYPTKTTMHLFSGYAFCTCGSKMYITADYPKYICQKCRNKIKATDLEEIFHEQLRTFFCSSDELLEYLNQSDGVIKDKEMLINSLEDEKRKLKNEMDKTHRLYLDDKITSDGFGRIYKPMEERFKQIDDQIPELQGEIDFLKIQLASSDTIINEAKDLYSHWYNLNREEKRNIIESITENITIGESDIDINLCYLPSSKKVEKGQRTVTGCMSL